MLDEAISDKRREMSGIKDLKLVDLDIDQILIERLLELLRNTAEKILVTR